MGKLSEGSDEAPERKRKMKKVGRSNGGDERNVELKTVKRNEKKKKKTVQGKRDVGEVCEYIGTLL